MPEISNASKAMGSLSLETTTPSSSSKATTAPAEQKGKGKSKATKKKKAEVLDSWEDASSDSESEIIPTPLTSTSNTDTGTDTGTGTPTYEAAGFRAPPPTPATPTNYDAESVPWTQQLGAVTEDFSPATTRQPPPPRREHSGSDGDAAGGGGRRPEKTDAVARRMIAGALGMRAPRPTEEQRAYDRAVREKERRRRDEEREAEKLFVLFDRLEKTGVGVQNPFRKAFEEGKIQYP